MQRARHETSTHRTGIRRYLTGPTVTVVALVSLSACGSSGDADAGNVSTDDLQQLQDQLTALDNRVATVEQDFSGSDFGGPGSAGGNTNEGFGNDPAAALGDEVTVSAAVSELVGSSEAGAVFLVAGDDGVPIPVVSADPTVPLRVGEVVTVSGTVVLVDPDTFADDFGVAAAELLDDADVFLEEREGEIALAADEVRPADDQPDGS